MTFYGDSFYALWHLLPFYSRSVKSSVKWLNVDVNQTCKFKPDEPVGDTVSHLNGSGAAVKCYPQALK